MAIEWAGGKDLETVMVEGLREFEQHIHNVLFSLAQYHEAEAEAWMKGSAPWTDRTANARQTLWTKAERIPNGVQLKLSHGVYYGLYLEVANAGKYAIVIPGRVRTGAKMYQDMKKIFD